jgi:hypothetical protein
MFVGNEVVTFINMVFILTNYGFYFLISKYFSNLLVLVSNMVIKY